MLQETATNGNDMHGRVPATHKFMQASESARSLVSSTLQIMISPSPVWLFCLQGALRVQFVVGWKGEQQSCCWPSWEHSVAFGRVTPGGY